MISKLQYAYLGLATVFLIGIGLIVDRVGGFGIRTDDVSSPVTLSFAQPLIRGVPLTIRWQGEGQQNFGVVLQLISPSETVSLGSGKLLAGSMRITIPCTLPEGGSRIELLDASTNAILATSAVNILPPGPDCVR